jgi:hypothetical protein
MAANPLLWFSLVCSMITILSIGVVWINAYGFTYPRREDNMWLGQKVNLTWECQSPFVKIHLWTNGMLSNSFAVTPFEIASESIPGIEKLITDLLAEKAIFLMGTGLSRLSQSTYRWISSPLPFHLAQKWSHR